MSETTSDKNDAIMVREFPNDVKGFILDAPAIFASLSLARDEMTRVFGILGSEVAKQNWHDGRFCQNLVHHSHLRIWRRDWRSDQTEGCPWIYYEYMLNWNRGSLEARLCINCEKDLVPQATSDVLGKAMAERIETGRSRLWQAGWRLYQPLKSNVFFLEWATSIAEESFSAGLVVDTGLKRMNELAELRDDIEQVIAETFGGAGTA